MPTAPQHPRVDLGPRFDVRVCERPDEILVTVQGELDVATSPQLAAALSTGADRRPMLVDLRAVTFIDSSALLALTRARHDRLRLRVLADGGVRRIMDISGLVEYLGVEDGAGPPRDHDGRRNVANA